MAENFLYGVIFFDLGDTLVKAKKDSSSGERKEWIASALETIDRLAAIEIKLGILSNTGDLTRKQLAELLPEDFRFDKFHPDLTLLSSEVAKDNVAPKPALEIFRLALARAEAVSQRACLYCSENLKETLAAQQAGMHAMRLLPPKDQNAESELGNLVELLESVAALKNGDN